MSAFTPGVPERAALAPLASRFVAVAKLTDDDTDMLGEDWEKAWGAMLLP